MGLMTILIVLLIIALIGGITTRDREWGPWGWSPLGLILIVVLILALTGHL